MRMPCRYEVAGVTPLRSPAVVSRRLYDHSVRPWGLGPIRRLVRAVVVTVGTCGTLVAVGTAGGAVTTPHTTQSPVCGASGAEQVCVEGGSTGLTFTYSSSSDSRQYGGASLVDSFGPSETPLLNLAVNWQGTGTLFLPVAPGSWEGVAASTGVGVPFISVVGPGQPTPPTTCSTVAQGTVPSSAVRSLPWVSAISATMNGNCPGYWIATPDGAVDSVGGAALLGGDYSDTTGISAGGVTGPINGSIVGMARTPGSQGYWLAASDGGVFAPPSGTFGTSDAGFYGSMGNRHLNRPVVGIAATPDGKGYWLVASDGGVFAFGDAGFYGSMGGKALNAPVVGIAATPDGKGYWLVASDGGVFAFGDAGFHGSMGDRSLSRPIVGVAATPDGQGYWLVASDGGVFAFGAPFLGSLGGKALSAPIVAVSPSATGSGYYLLGADSAVYTFGAADYLGAPAGAGGGP